MAWWGSIPGYKSREMAHSEAGCGGYHAESNWWPDSTWWAASECQEWSQILPGDTSEIWWAPAQPLPMSTNCRMGFLRSTPQDGDLCTYWGLLWKAVGLGRGKRKSWSGQLQGNSEVQWLSEWHWVGSKWPVFQTGSWVSPWNWSTLIGMISVPGESLCWGHPDGMDV